MSATITFNEQRRQGERRSILERRRTEGRRKAITIGENVQSRVNKHDRALDLLGSVLAVGLSIIVLVLTGVYQGASSTVAQIMLIAAIVYAYVVAFRRAFYS